MKLRDLVMTAAVIQLAAATCAVAQEWEASTQRYLGSPGFLPIAGEVEGSFTYTYAADLYDYRPNDPFGLTREYNRSENAFLPALTYGITDDIAVSANLGWGNSRNVENYSYYGYSYIGSIARYRLNHATASFHALGADNPTFSATWRAIDERFAPVDIDLTASYSPDIFKSTGAGTNQTGSFATGGQSGSVQLAVMREMQFLTLRAYGTFSYEGRRNESLNGGYDDARSAPHASYQAGLQGEARLLPWMAINAGVTASQSVRFDQSEIFAGGETTTAITPGGSLTPYAGLVLQVLPQRVATEFLYEHAFITDETHVASGTENRYFKQESNEFVARVLFTLGGRRAALPPQAQAPAPVPPVVAIDRTYLVFFDWDRADLSARARLIITEAAHETTRRLVTRIDVNGYTDLSGGVAYNQKLSIRRAQSVEAELVRDGVNRDEISMHGYGESHPLVPTAAGAREPQNRRVEIIFH